MAARKPRTTPRKKVDTSAQVLRAIYSTRGHFRARSAPGLAKQTHTPLEHVEAHLVRLAQEGSVSLGRDHDNVLWATTLTKVGADEDLA